MLFFVPLLFISVVGGLQNGFTKDLNTNSQFPPILERRDGIPLGHLRPLGWQNRPEGIIKEESVKIQPAKFWLDYVVKNKPVVIRGLVNGAEAIDKWSDVYLSRKYSDIDIYVKNKKQKVSEINRKMKFKDFLKGYRSEDWYLRVILPYEMQKEVPMPGLINCGPYIDENIQKKVVQLMEPYLWMSAGETSSLLHLHSENNFHCLLDGRKDFILIPTEQLKERKTKDWKELLNLQETYKHSNEFISKIDVDMVNVFKYKILNELKWYWSTLKTGDCIFIPANYLHQVRSFGRSISKTTSFTLLKTHHLKTADSSEEYAKTLFDSCEQNAPLFQQMHLFNKNFLFSYTHGDRHLVKKNLKPFDAKYLLMYLLHNDSSLYFEKFDHFLKGIATELSIESKFDLDVESLKIWAQLDGNSKGFLTYEDIINIKDENLKLYLMIIQNAANFHERSQIEGEL